MKKLLLSLTMALVLLATGTFGADEDGIKFWDNSASETKYYDTLADLVAAETIAGNDIIDGQRNSFNEVWTMQSDGTGGNPIIYKHAMTKGFVDDGKDYILGQFLIANGSSGDGFSLTGENNRWLSCVSYGSSSLGFDVDESAVITNCILFNNTGGDMDVANTKSVEGKHNCFEDAAIAGTGAYTDTNTLWDTDPLFYNAANNDFRLRSDSPCRNAGTDKENYGKSMQASSASGPGGDAPTFGAGNDYMTIGAGGDYVTF